MEQLAARVSNLLSVKSIVTIVLTIVFAVMCARGMDIPQPFLTLYTVVVSFYFGTQSQKLQEAVGLATNVLTGGMEIIDDENAETTVEDKQ